ncbi:MAG TPA: TonB-dependent receptor, partial [Cytophagales bacterium]|nr:TonB-dependent receptor [Cytophagales bacterium]
MKQFACVVLGLLWSVSTYAQHTFKAQIIDAESGEPLLGATAKISPTQGAVSDAEGNLEITNILSEEITVEVSFVGYEEWSQVISLPQTKRLTIALEHDEHLEEVIITATRSTRTIDDLPTRVEAITSEELDEKSMMRSANIAMLLRESTGIQMQQTSASSGNQSIRIQGLDGRYTQLLKDGFPIFGGFAGGLSIMQIPPLDLRQVEVIKGSNSTLYGGGAIAGLVNLVTHTPEEKRRLRLMVDQTTARGTTLNGFYAQRFGAVGVSLFASANRQQAYDPNEDSFSDLPQIRSLTVNPSLFFYLKDNSLIRVTLNGTVENRRGGDMNQISERPNGVHTFVEENATDRFNYQLSYQKPFANGMQLNVRHSLTYFDRGITTTDFSFQGEQYSTFSEANFQFGKESFRWTVGVNGYTDTFNEFDVDSLRRDYTINTLGVFAQNTWDINPRWALESGLRVEYDPNYGEFILPRVALLSRINEQWTARLSGGAGYKQPTLFTEEAENLIFRGIEPLFRNGFLAPERSWGGNLDVNYQTAWGDDWTFSVNQLFFYTWLTKPLVLQPYGGADSFVFVNAEGPLTSNGTETNVKLTYKDFKLFANYAFANTLQRYREVQLQSPLTPRHRMGSVLMWEAHGKGRIGLEAYYTGEQRLEDGTATQPFWIV